MSEPSIEELIARAQRWGRIARWLAVVACLLAVAAVVVSLVNGPTVTVTLR